MATRRKGKIAALPFAIRQQVNVALRDGCTYGDVAKMLAGLGYTDITEKNVENWTKPGDDGTSGYLDWTKEQERLEDLNRKREFALQVVQQHDSGTIHEAAIQLAASQLYEVITEFDLASLKEQLREEPERYQDIVNSLARLSKSGIDYARYRDQVAERKRAIESEIGKARDKGGVTAETLERIERELKLL